MRTKVFMLLFSIGILTINDFFVHASTNIKFTLSEPTIIDQSIVPWAGYWPDGKFCFLPKKDNNGWVCYWGEGDSFRTEAATTLLEDHIANNNWRMVMGRDVDKVDGFNDGGSWIIGIHRLESGKLVGFFHAESHWDDSGIAYKSIGVTYSNNDGLTWERGQRIISTKEPKPESPTWSGLGDACIVWNEKRQQYICYYQGWWLCMAASSDPNGAPGTWKIWDGNDFTIEACNQESQTAAANGKPISGLESHAGCNPSVMYNEFLQRWLMVYSGWNDYVVYMSVSKDGIEWESPIALFGESIDGHRYPNLVSDEGGDQKGGKTLRLYYATNQREWGHRDIGCRTLVFENEKLSFADSNVKALCIGNWDTNDDGELNEVEAAAVTDLGEVFKGNTTITSFNELQYFTGLTSIRENAFYGCSCLTSVTIPNSVTSIGDRAFSGCTSLTSVKVDTETPVSITDNTFSNRANATLYIPAGSIEAYRSANYWKEFKNIIEFLEGDVNNDGEMDVVDVVDIARFVVGSPAETFVEILADINSDGSVNIGDAVTLVNEIAGDQNFVRAKRAPSKTAESEDVLSLTQTDEGLALVLVNQRDYTAFQFDLFVPEGTDVARMLLNAERKQKHQLLYNKVEEGHYRVAALSTSNRTFQGNDGELLSIALNSDNDGEIAIRNIHFFDTKGGDYMFNEILYKGATTGIAVTPSTTPMDGAFYTIDGRRIGKKPATKGLYIVNGKKIVIK